jgi:hypothetical protein
MSITVATPFNWFVRGVRLFCGLQIKHPAAVWVRSANRAGSSLVCAALQAERSPPH